LGRGRGFGKKRGSTPGGGGGPHAEKVNGPLGTGKTTPSVGRPRFGGGKNYTRWNATPQGGGGGGNVSTKEGVNQIGKSTLLGSRTTSK